MTGEDHNTDALIAALRSPALPAEQVGEAAVVTAMIEVQTPPAASHGLRSRRGIAVAAVTVASLGIGGLAAAGPGIFSPAADQRASTPPEPIAAPAELSDDEDEQGDDVDLTATLDVEPRGVDRITEDPNVDCADGSHGRTASGVAQETVGDGVAVEQAARSNCGKPDLGTDTGTSDEATLGTTLDTTLDGADEATDDECDEDNHGQTVSSIARNTESGPGKGDVVSEAARSKCDQPDTPDNSDDAPGNSANAPGQTGSAPGRTDDASSQTDAPGNSANAPGQTDDAPGRTDDASSQTDAPGNSDDAPGRTDDAPGRTDDAPGRTDDAPGQADKSAKNKP